MKKVNQTYIIYILFVIIIISTYIYLCNTILEKFTENKSIEIVVSRYNETLEWLNEEPFNRYPVVIYNKGPNDDFIKSNRIKKIIPLDNIGRESHTYLYHIINNYDNLSDITNFLPGSTSIDYKKTKAINVISNISDKTTNIFACSKEDVYETNKDFVVDNYLSTNDENKKMNTDSKIQVSDIRPFGKWYRTFFSDQKTDCISYNGIFAVSKTNVLNRPISFYESLLNEVNKHHNPETGHYIERSWVAIFSSDHDEKMYV